ncbi:MAG: glycoside hydrolase family 65 protein, partial [Anaerolineaceae bacterium]
HGMWDDVEIGYTELANAPDWTALEVWINDQRFSMDRGRVEDYARYIDLRSGVLRRRLRWTSDGDIGRFDLTFERFASLADPHLMVVRVQVQALDGPASVEIQASLNSHVDNWGHPHWDLVSQGSSHQMVSLEVATRSTQKTLAMSAQLTTNREDVSFEGRDDRGNPGIRLRTELEEGGSFTVDKLVAMYTSRDADDPLAASQSNLLEAIRLGYEVLFNEHKDAWREFWNRSDVILEGDDEAQLAIRHALFQLRIAASSDDERVSIGAKTLSGFGYRGHVFWDNEIFVLPFFTYTQPSLARNMLMYRWNTIQGARRKAADNGYVGAQYAWESAESGDEVTPRWVPDWKDPTKKIRIWTGDIQIHITADIAYAIWQYWQVTGDDEFMRHVGTPIILETAIFWGDRVEPVSDGYALSQVIGPDEYHHHVDNNAFTNAMVRWHLEKAVELREWLHQTAPEDVTALDRRLGITAETLTKWRDIAGRLKFNHDPKTGLIEQFDGFFELPDVEWDRYGDRTASMQSLLGIEGANQHQVLKQADVIMLLCLLRDQFDDKTWRANWDYYNPRTDHSYGSSLGPAIHAWAACELERPDIAYKHFMRAARADLQDARGNAGDGIHAASAGGLWQALVFGFAGLELTQDSHRVSPRLPTHWKRLSFSFCHRGERHEVDIRRA